MCGWNHMLHRFAETRDEGKREEIRKRHPEAVQAEVGNPPGRLGPGLDVAESQRHGATSRQAELAARAAAED
eukprot:3557910-Amphidinium_carterae.1